jgi:hypothetical protein
MMWGMALGRKSNTLAGSCARAALLAAVFAAGRAGADELIARAQAAEAEQQRALVGHAVLLESRGVLRDGKTPHEVQTWRRIVFGAAGPTLTLLRATFDGQPVDEAQLRDKITGGRGKKTGADVVLSVLTPLHDGTCVSVGPAEAGGARLRCVPRTPGGKVVSVEVVVDAATGKKRSATPTLGGPDYKHADKAEFTMRFADDGAPADYRSFTHGRFLFWEKSFEMTGHRQ